MKKPIVISLAPLLIHYFGQSQGCIAAQKTFPGLGVQSAGILSEYRQMDDGYRQPVFWSLHIFGGEQKYYTV
jgi:hypothetical protein